MVSKNKLSQSKFSIVYVPLKTDCSFIGLVAT